MKTISIIKADYIGELTVKLYFNDQTSRVVDFKNFFSQNSHPQFNQYKKPERFEKFNIAMGNIVWGKNWDLVFPVYDLYCGKI